MPISESRVTSAANAFSSRPSVPAGRCGSTQYRISDEESQTRTSTESGMSSPKSSRSTVRGSRTIRDR